ncbi:MAG: galactose-1-phosphate uridylyltransferase [Nanobdellota archaeon]
MPELRKDYVLDRYVIIAKERGDRPHKFRKPSPDKEKGRCFFCPGNEHLTPEETGRREDHNGWYLRWFDNKFPAIQMKGDPDIRTHDEFFTFSDAYGKHEVIVESPDHEDYLCDLSEGHIAELLKVYNERIEALRKEEGIEYVQILKNHLPKAGTSIPHTHSQVIAYNMIPRIIKEKEKGNYKGVISKEKDSDRRAFENETFVSFTPYASRNPLELLIMPKREIRYMHELNEKEFSDFASILKKALLRLKELNAPYNFYIHYRPHLQLVILPRLSTWAGFEIATETIINPLSPEKAAGFYRGEQDGL